MKKIKILIFIVFSFFSFAANPLYMHAAECNFDHPSVNELCNPISGINNLNDAKVKALKLFSWFLGVIGIVAVIMIVYAGARMVISAGNEEQINGAKKTITWAIIGLAVSMLAYSIVAIIENLIQRQ